MLRVCIAVATALLAVISLCPAQSTPECAPSLSPNSYYIYNETIKRCIYTSSPPDGVTKYCTEVECYTHSQTPQELCTSDKIVGRCLAYMPSYYYNATIHECEEFIYGGCEGNGNRFPTEKACLDFCKGISCE